MICVKENNVSMFENQCELCIYQGGVGVLSILRIVTKWKSFYASLSVRMWIESPIHGCFRREIRGSYWSGIYATPKDTIDGLPKGFLINYRASMGYIDGDHKVGNRVQGVSAWMPQLMSAYIVAGLCSPATTVGPVLEEWSTTRDAFDDA